MKRSAPATRGDLRFYALGDGGVLFDPVKQEIYALRGAAALLWIALDEGCEPALGALTRALTRGAGLLPDEASRQAADLLRRWRECGWIAVEDSAPVHAVRTPEPAERSYRLLDSRFWLRVEDPAIDALVSPALAHLEAPLEGEPDFTMCVRADGRTFILERDGRLLERCAGPWAVLPFLQTYIQVAVNDRHAFQMAIHAGAVGDARGCALLAAPAGSGKTTLTMALVGSGLRYFGDDVALLEPETLRVRPAPVAPSIKDGSAEVLREVFPEIAELNVHLREDGKRIRYLPLPPESIAPDRSEGYLVRHLVFPSYLAGQETALRSLDPLEGLDHLLASCVTLPRNLTSTSVQALVAWMRRTPASELQVGDLAGAVAAVRGLFGRDGA